MQFKGWAVLALLASASGPAFGQNQPIEVAPAPIHPAVETPDDAAAMPPPQLSPYASVERPTGDGGPHVAIARRMIDAAGAFDGYMRRAGAIKADFHDGRAVARAVALGSVYEPVQLEQGAIAYAALVALQDPLFVQAVQDAAAGPGGREAFAAHLADQPEWVLNAGAARRAASRVSAVVGRMGADLVVAGIAVKQASYDLQTQDWSKGAIVGGGESLARIKAQSATRVSLLPEDQTHLIGGLAAFRAADGPAPAEADRATAVVTRGMALAALAVLGEAGEDQGDRVDSLLSYEADLECLKMAKLNEYQCLAVAGPHYEDLFCLGNHGMIDTGKCIAAAAGLDPAALGPAGAPAVDRRSVLAPVALTSDEGSERSDAFGPTRGRPGVSVPVAAVAVPETYSPYAGPAD